VALFLDGKSFADEEIIIALGVTLDGQKIPLGFVQAATVICPPGLCPVL